MCGIAGMVAKNYPVDAAALLPLIEGIRHRGPDDSGQHYSANRFCGLGHARLSILDLSVAGHQPMIDSVTGNVIVFNGEIYNFAQLRHACERDGYIFQSHTDTEVILALYRQYGTGCLEYLRGMFAFAIWDEARQHLFFARDRVGKKPFYYSQSPQGFAFCSEIQPLSLHPWVDSGMDDEALDLFLQLQYIPAPWCIYRGIRKLPPAHYGICTRSGLRIHAYWQPNYREKLEISEVDALDGLEEKLTEAIRLRMVADVPVGALLSGGVDSSVVVALMAKLSGTPVRTFSIGFEEAPYDESAYAQFAAQRCGTLHRPKILPIPDTSRLPLLVQRYGEPFADSSALPSFAVCAFAREEVKVVMNGDGGDELLGGYPRYSIPDPVLGVASLLQRNLRLPLGDPVAWLGGRGRFPWKKIRRLLGRNLLLPDARPLTMYSAFWDDIPRRELFPHSTLQNTLRDWRAQWFAEARFATDNPIDSMLWLDNRTYLPGDLLVKMDIAAMHCGLEARSPLLDHELIEFCAKLPVAYKVRRGVGKYLLKKLAERFYPPEFIHREKMGFGIPLNSWLKGPLRPLLEESLNDPRCVYPLDETIVRRCLERFLAGDHNEVSRLWSLFMYALWRRHCVG